jgi:hypothetical protein
MYFLPHARKDTNSAAPPVFSPLRGELRPNGGKIGAGAMRGMTNHIFG